MADRWKVLIAWWAFQSRPGGASPILRVALLTKKDVARLPACSIRMVERLVASGTLTADKIGGAVRFRKRIDRINRMNRIQKMQTKAVVAGVVIILAAGITTVMVRNSGHHARVELPADPVAEASFQGESAVRFAQSKQWAVACLMFAADHGDQLPKVFEQLKSYVPGLSDSNWEMVSGGNLNSFVNPSETARTILLREKEARESPAGPFVKVYAFADGHAELISSADKDFAALEKQRGFVARPAKD